MTNTPATDERPLVASLCGTFLKPEMQSVYRQVARLRRFRTVVFTERESHRDQFPFDPVVVMEKRRRPRPRGNFLLRFYYKYITRQWPPPRPVNRQVKPYHPYNLPDLLREHRPAAAHVYYGHKAVKYRGMLEAWGGPWLVSFHGVDVAKFIDRPGYRDGLAKVFAEAALVLARSQSLLDRLRDDLGCPAEKLRLNRTPLPVDGFPVVGRAWPAEGHFRLVQASRLIAKKGLFTTLEALRLLRPDFPGLRFVVCGDGPERPRVEEAARQLGLGEMVELPGWVDQTRLRHELAAAHVFLHPSETTASQDQEGVPNSMLEAMATGLPVVATRHGGIPEAVRHGIDGLLVPEKDPAALAGAIRTLLENQEAWQGMATAAAESVRLNFGEESAIGALEDAYAELLAMGNRD